MKRRRFLLRGVVLLLLLAFVSAGPANAYYLLGGQLNGGLYNRNYSFGKDNNYIHSQQDFTAFQAAIADWNWVLGPANAGNLFLYNSATGHTEEFPDFYFKYDPGDIYHNLQLFGSEVNFISAHNDWNNGTVAQTFLYKRNITTVNGATQITYEELDVRYLQGAVWDIATIEINTVSCISDSNSHSDLFGGELTGRTWDYSKEMRKILNHEIGHAVGLKHSNNDIKIVNYSDLGDVGKLMCPMGNYCTAYVPTRDDVNGVNAIYKVVH